MLVSIIVFFNLISLVAEETTTIWQHHIHVLTIILLQRSCLLLLHLIVIFIVSYDLNCHHLLLLQQGSRCILLLPEIVFGTVPLRLVCLLWALIGLTWRYCTQYRSDQSVMFALHIALAWLVVHVFLSSSWGASVDDFGWFGSRGRRNFHRHRGGLLTCWACWKIRV